MPARIVLQLDAAQRLTSDPTPRQLHGLVSTMLGESDDEHTAADKPWSTVLRSHDHKLYLLIGWISPDAPPPISSKPVRLGSQRFQSAVLRHERFGFAELVAGGVHEVGIEILTPTWFMRGGFAFPFPDPFLMYRRLLERWNSNAPEPLQIPSPVGNSLLDQLELVAWSGQTHPFDIGRGTREGFVGRLVVAVPPETSHEAKQALAALTRFAELAGVGAQTTFGAGHVRTLVGTS